MPVAQETPGTATYPVVRRAAIGERFIGAYIKHASRNILKDGKDVINATTGRPRQEMVVHCLVMPGTTATVGNAENAALPAEGDIVRLILKGKAFGQWIDGLKALSGVQRAGDVLEMVIDQAQAYDQDGNVKGAVIHTQADADKVPRGVTLGFYGPLTLRPCTAAEMPWIAKADEAFATIGSGRTASSEEDSGGVEPF